MKYSISFRIDDGQVGKEASAFACFGEKNRKETTTLRMHLWWEGGCTSFDVGYCVDKDGWDTKVQRCKRGTWHGSNGNVAACVVNGRIRQMADLAHEALSRCDVMCKKEDVAEKLRNAIGEASPLECTKQNAGLADATPMLNSEDSLVEWMSAYVDNRCLVNEWSAGTRKKYEELVGYIRSFDADATISDVDNKWLGRLTAWFATLGLHNLTVKIMLGMLKWFLRWAEDAGVTSGEDWKRFSPRLKIVPRKVIFLTWEELMRVYSIELDEAPLRWARDLFCLQCFTSLRYSDVSKLRHVQVRKNHIELVTQKTRDCIVVELNKYARELTERYAHLEGVYAMPQLSIQRVNLLLKEIGKRAGLDEPVEMVWYVGSRRVVRVCPKWELLSTHCGRRTFICTSLAMGIPVETIMKWTGHNDYKAMRPYIEVADTTKQREMAKWDRWGE